MTVERTPKLAPAKTRKAAAACDFLVSGGLGVWVFRVEGLGFRV